MDQYDLRLTKEYIKKLLRSDHKLYYSTPSLNDVLYLHYKGFKELENLEEFNDLKVLYFEGNGINKIQNLENNVNLRCLYIQENLIKKMENMDQLVELRNINLTDNMIETVDGLKNLKHLSTLLLKRNRLGRNGKKDLEGILECPSISVLDIQDNHFEDEDIVDVLKQMPNLGVLYLQNNPVCKKIRNYRKKILHEIPTLKYLDDRPVFEDERRYVAAFWRGGIEEERNERKKYKKEQEEKHLENHRKFKEMIEQAKREQQEEQRQQYQQQQEEQNNQPQEQNQQQNQSDNQDVPELEAGLQESSETHESSINKYEIYNTSNSQVSRHNDSELSNNNSFLKADSDAESVKSVKAQISNLDDLD